MRGAKYYIIQNLYHQHRVILGIDRLRYTNNLTSKSLYKLRNQAFKTKQKALDSFLRADLFARIGRTVGAPAFLDPL